MQTKFFSCGFLYHPATVQILLQQTAPDEPTSPWTLIGAVNEKGETPEKAFQRIIKECLKISVPVSKINVVYDYHDPDLDLTRYVVFAELPSTKEFRDFKGYKFDWFTPKEISKLKLKAQAKRDLVVGQRVIDSMMRKSLGEQTIG